MEMMGEEMEVAGGERWEWEDGGMEMAVRK